MRATGFLLCFGICPGFHDNSEIAASLLLAARGYRSVLRYEGVMHDIDFIFYYCWLT